jgi:hypothetical protein
MKQILILLFAAITLCSSSSDADTKELKSVLKNSRLRSTSAQRMQWTKADTNYALLFAHNGKNASLLLDWIGTPAGDFQGYDPIFKYNHDLVELRRTFHVRTSFRKVQLNVLVPAPDRVSGVKYGLMQEFSQYVPPVLKFKDSEKVKIRDAEADVYYQSNGRCSLLLRLEGEVYVRLEGLYDDRNDLVKLAELLNFERISQKLKL